MSVDKVKMYFQATECVTVKKSGNFVESGKTRSGLKKYSLYPQGYHKRLHGSKGLKILLVESGDMRLEFGSKLLSEKYLEGLNRSNIHKVLKLIEKIVDHSIEFKVNKVLHHSRVVKVENKLDLKCESASEKKRYVETFKYLRFPRRKVKQFGDTTLFKSKKKSCQLYPKDEEMEEKNSSLYRDCGGKDYFANYLRFECCHETSAELRKIYGKQYGGFVSLSDVLDNERSKEIVLSELEKLSLPKNIKFPKVKTGFKDFMYEQLEWNYAHGHNRIIRDVGAHTVVTKFFNKDWEELTRIYTNSAKDRKKAKSRIEFYRKHYVQHDLFTLNELTQSPSETLVAMRRKFREMGI